jgi:hypothetical protein
MTVVARDAETTLACWHRLQALSCAHAIQLGPQYGFGRRRQHTPPEVIRENCEILGNGSEEEIKHRVHWYITYYPGLFEAASSTKGWRLT